jgi:hypothetical protein
MRKKSKKITINYSGENICQLGVRKNMMKEMISVLKEKCGYFPVNMDSSYDFESKKGYLTYTFYNSTDFPDSSRMETILQNHFNSFPNLTIRTIEVNDGRETYILKNKNLGTTLK